jgi:hypothetical protein
LDQDEFDNELNELEIRLERLRSLYEQYFLGIERIEPAVARKDVDRRFWRIRKVRVRNTARRFKLQTLLQRYNTLQQHWTKTCRRIENGTHIRQLARAKRRMGDVAEDPVPLRRRRNRTTASETSGQSVPPPPRPQSAGGQRSPSFDDKIDRLHRELSEAQAKHDPGSRTVSRKALAESLRMTEAKLRHKHSGKEIEFRVVLKDGRAAIKPVVKKTAE